MVFRAVISKEYVNVKGFDSVKKTFKVAVLFRKGSFKSR